MISQWKECDMKGKKILMFGPDFFGYREKIAEELIAMGAQVDLYDERPSNSAFCKIMLRSNLKLYRPVVTKYYRQVIAENRGKDYDYVFVIKSEGINEKIFTMLRQAFPKAKFILYLWDSVENVPDGERKLALYDRVLTFDHVDAEAYNLPLRPLFCCKEYSAHPESQKSYRYDAAFIGTAHSIRPRVVRQVSKICEDQGGQIFAFLFLPHKLVYYYHKLTNPAYRGIRRQDIHFDALTAEEIRAVYDQSRCILDVEHCAQRGLTMRTIEMMGMGKKLITTNTGIQNYDFYHPNNICVIDRKNPRIPKDFWTSPYVPVPGSILQRYSLRAFVEDIFDVKE